MASGSASERWARADRIRERSRQLQRGTDNALSELQRSRLESFTGDEDEVSEVTLGKEGLRAKGVPSWAAGIAVVIIAAAGAAWLVAKALGH